MKKSIRFLLGLFLVFTVAGSAGATTYTDTYVPKDSYMEGIFSSIAFWETDVASWTFDIRNDEYDPDSQTVTSAKVEFYISDDGGFFDGIESVLVYVDQLDGQGWPDDHQWAEWEWETWTWEMGNKTLEVESLISLNTDGTLDMSLRALTGDFFFHSAVLTAEATDPVVPVPNPEPATMMLFGLGLLGLAGIGRKQS